MEANEYQSIALETAIFDKKNPIAYCILGLTGEAGEVANKYKKVLRGDKELTDDLKFKIADELGDVMWYSAVLARELGFSFQEILDINIDKLKRRRENNTIMGDGDSR